MLVFLFTDAALDRSELQQALVAATDRTFNCCSVDGDTSTNDTVLALASGATRTPIDARRLQDAMFTVCDELAGSMVLDGEGSEHAVQLKIVGLRSDDDALRVARVIATSLLVKTALNGRDANWGRILAAAGRAGVPFEPTEARIRVGDIDIVQGGLGVGSRAEQDASTVMARPTYTLEVRLGEGPGEARYWMTDLGHSYIDVNAGYRS
jgi:glutamate N-acetyltransferase/amino-acid N-acetyltransferase